MMQELARARRADAGIALMTTMMIMLLLSSLLIGFAVMVTSDSQLSTMDLGNTDAFYLANAGLEKLTADLGALFIADTTPTGNQVRALADTPPEFPDMTFVAPGGGDGYTITFPTTTGNPATGDPVTEVRTVTSGPFQGMVGLVTPYELNVTARKTVGAEASVRRTVQTASVPIFEFGAYAETDLAYFPGPSFTFGGMVHTNGNLFLATGGGPMSFTDRLSAYGEVIRTHLANGYPTTSGYTGTVRATTAPGAYRNLGLDEGSLVGTVGSAPREPGWTNLSTGTYNSRLINRRTGARRLSLPLTTLGTQPIDLIRRPPPGETAASLIFNERHFARASVRILLSDTAANITSLPTVSATPPVQLGNLAVNPIPGYVVDGAHPPLPLTRDGSSTGAPGYASGSRFPLDTPRLGGFLKIEIQTTPGNWQDVTVEILNLGIAGRSISGACAATNPNPNAVIRLQRVRDDGTAIQQGACGVSGGGVVSSDPHDYWPNVLYDPREGIERDVWTSQHYHNQFLGGVMHYVELDVRNLSRWLQGQIGVSGPTAVNQNGYLVYFSDRRNNRNTAGSETGEYGWEDFVNSDSVGTPNGIRDNGEDVNANNALDIYGQTPRFPAGLATGTVPLTASARPWTWVGRDTSASEQYLSRANPAIFFRRGLKLVSGGLGNIVMPGLTITSENPLYIQGDYNSSAAAGFGEPNAAAAVIADAVTLLSNNWNDWRSFDEPHRPVDRPATTTWYRLGIATGTTLNFPRPAGTPGDFGTDGGVPNLLRFLEDWNTTAQTINFRGSVAVLFVSRQGRGTFKCCNNVYRGPIRAFQFDTDFLDLNLLPPATPMLTDVNITGFAQIIRPQ